MSYTHTHTHIHLHIPVHIHNSWAYALSMHSVMTFYIIIMYVRNMYSLIEGLRTRVAKL